MTEYVQVTFESEFLDGRIPERFRYLFGKIGRVKASAFTKHEDIKEYINIEFGKTSEWLPRSWTERTKKPVLTKKEMLEGVCSNLQ